VGRLKKNGEEKFEEGRFGEEKLEDGRLEGGEVKK